MITQNKIERVNKRKKSLFIAKEKRPDRLKTY